MKTPKTKVVLPRRAPLVEVLWMDIWTKPGDHTADEARTVELWGPRRTAGYLVEESADCIRVAHTYDAPKTDEPQHTFCDITPIPKQVVKRLRYVERRRTTKPVTHD